MSGGDLWLCSICKRWNQWLALKCYYCKADRDTQRVITPPELTRAMFDQAEQQSKGLTGEALRAFVRKFWNLK